MNRPSISDKRVATLAELKVSNDSCLGSGCIVKVLDAFTQYRDGPDSLSVHQSITERIRV